MPRMTQPTVMNTPPPQSGGGGLLSGLMGIIGLATGQPWLGGVGSLLEGNFEQGMQGLAQAFQTTQGGDPNAAQSPSTSQQEQKPEDQTQQTPQPQTQIPTTGGVDPNSTQPAPADPQVQPQMSGQPSPMGFGGSEMMPAPWQMTQPGIPPQLLAMMIGPTFQQQGITGFGGGPYPNPFMT